MARTADGFGVFGRRFDSGGSAIGGEFQINAYTTDVAGQLATLAYRRRAAASSRPGRARAGRLGLRHLRSAASTAAAWPIRRRDSRSTRFTVDDQIQPDGCSSSGGGDFVVVWTSDTQDGDNYGVFGRAFNAQAQPRGGEIQVNTTTANVQRFRAWRRPGSASSWCGRAPIRTARAVGSSAAASWSPHTLDVDGDGQVLPLTDALLILRYTFGFRGNTLITGRGRRELHALRRAIDRGLPRSDLSRSLGAGPVRRRGSSRIRRPPSMRNRIEALGRRDADEAIRAMGGHFRVCLGLDASRIAGREQSGHRGAAAVAPSSRSTPTRRSIRRSPAIATDSQGNFVVVWEQADWPCPSRTTSSLAASTARAPVWAPTFRSTSSPPACNAYRGWRAARRAGSWWCGPATDRTATRTASSAVATTPRATRWPPSSRSTRTPPRRRPPRGWRCEAGAISSWCGTATARTETASASSGVVSTPLARRSGWSSR